MASGTYSNPTSLERTYLLRFILEGITFVVHKEPTTGKYNLSEWSTGCRLTTFYDVDSDIGLDLIAEAEAQELLDKHGPDKFQAYIDKWTRLN